jgi:tetratricopeptide (TPR) repeat protein
MQLGPYRAEAYGPVELSAAPEADGTERVTATASGGPCDFPTGTEVFSGEFQGDTVLVGSLLLCQEGAGCPAQVSVPVLATYNATDRMLSALVRLQEGCSSRALARGSSLVVLRSTAKEPDGESEAPEEGKAGEPMSMVPVRGAAPEGVESSAESVAKALAETTDADIPDLMTRGQRALASGNFSNAAEKFGRVLFVDRGNVDARVGLAISNLGLKQLDPALKALEEARKQAPTRGDVHLWLAYVRFQKGGNLQDVRGLLDAALEKGWESGGRAEAQLLRPLENELAAARERLRRKQQGQAGAGSPSP